MTPERIARLRAVLDKRQPDLTVITDFVHKQRNTSAIVRNCDAVGIMQMHAVLNDRDYQAFRGTAMGSHRWVEVVRHESTEAAAATVKARGMQIVAAHLSDTTVDYRQVDFTRPTALLLGAEKRGVSERALALVDHAVSIPMQGMVASYNVAVAAGIILAEAQHQRSLAGLYNTPRIDAQTYQRLLFEWGHPVVRDYCIKNGLDYPALDADGEILDPPRWYGTVRAQMLDGGDA